MRQGRQVRCGSVGLPESGLFYLVSATVLSHGEWERMDITLCNETTTQPEYVLQFRSAAILKLRYQSILDINQS